MKDLGTGVKGVVDGYGDYILPYGGINLPSDRIGTFYLMADMLVIL